MKKVFSLFFITQLFLFSFSPYFSKVSGQASPSSILISELFPDPVSPQTDSSNEFIELYNPNDFSVDISGWVIKDNLKDKPVHNFSIPFLTIIDPYGFKVFYSSETPISLNNDGDIIELYNSSSELIDSTENYGEANAGKSYSFFDANWAWVDALTPGGANINNGPLDEDGGPQNLTPVNSAQILINELLPNPASPQTDSSDEFIELYNPNNFSVDLSNWILEDTVGSVKKYTISAGMSIGPLGYLVFFSRDSHISLNNSGDLVELYDLNGTQVNSSENYGKAPSGFSFSFNGSSWGWSEAMTPGMENVISEAKVEENDGSESTTKTKKKSQGTGSQSSSKKSSSKSSKSSNDKEILGSNTLNLVDNAPDILVAGENRSLGILFVVLGSIIGFGYLFYLNRGRIYERLSFFKQKSK